MRTLSLLLITLMLLLSSCLDKGHIEILAKKSRGGISSSNDFKVTNVSIVSDQLVIDGADLSEATGVRITGASFDETFAIETNNGSQIIANGLRAINFAVGSIFSLIISDAHGAATFSVSFTLQDGAVTASKLHDMGANDGDVLIYNNGTSQWEPRPLSGLSFKGSWDASTNSPTLSDGGGSTSPLAGDYYVVGTAGSTNIDGTSSWGSGDWIIFNGVSWDIIVNSSTITSFNGRQGAVVPAAGDYNVSDLGDVDTTGIAVGKVLKWSGTQWVIGDDLSSGGAGSVSSTEIADGTIVDADVSASAAIAQSKISGLTTDLAAKLPLDGSSAMTGDLDMGTNNITNVGNVDGVDVSALSTTVGTNTTNIATNTSAISTNATNIASKEDAFASGTTAQYFRGDKSWQTLDNAAVGLGNVTNDAQIPLANRDDGPLGTSTVNVPTENSVKTYVDAATGAITSSQWTTSGSRIYYNGGNVGIGITAPQSQLHISGGSSFSSFRMTNNNTGSSTTDGFQIEQNVLGTIAIYNRENSDIAIGTNSTERIKIRAGGNIGIGDTNPNEILTVGGVTSLVETTAPSNTANYGKVYVKSSDSKLYFMDDAGTEFDLTAAGTGAGDFFADGSVAMTGALDMGAQNITNIGTVDGVDISALDTTVSGKVAKAGDEMTGNLSMDNESAIQFQEATGNGDNFIAFKAPASLAGDVTFTLPPADGTSGQVLETDASGNLVWGDKTTDTDTTYTAGTGLDLTGTVFSVNSVDVDLIASAAGKYFTYQPNNVACTDGQVMKWSTTNTRWECAADAGAGGADASSILGEAIDTNLATNTTTDGQILVWSQTNSRWEVGSQTTDTNAGTVCSAGEYLDGNGTCITMNNSAVGLSNVTNDAQMPLSYLDVDDTLAADSDTRVPSQQAIKAYVDNQVSALGDVTGAASSTDNAIPRFDGTTGKVLQDSSVQISDTDQITGASSMVIGNITYGGSNISTPSNFNLSQGAQDIFMNNGNVQFNVGNSGGTAGQFRFVTNAASNMTASTERAFMLVDLSNSHNHNDGDITRQRDFSVRSTTHTWDGGDTNTTMTDGATFAVNGPPSMGTGTLTNAHSIWVESKTLDTDVINSYGLTVNATTGATNNYAAQFTGGNVGIGVSAPNELLTVEGVTSLRETTAPSNTANYGKLYVKSSDSKLYFMDDAGTETSLLDFGSGSGDFLANGTVAMTGDLQLNRNIVGGNTGNVIDTGTSAGNNLTIRTSDADIWLRTVNNDDIYFTTNSNERMRIKNTGEVGIGTATPNEKLTVEGVASLKEVAAPTNTADYGKLYVKASDSKLYFMDDAGTETSILDLGSSAVTSVTATAPLASSGGATPDISISQSNTTTDGYLSSTDWNTFNNKIDSTYLDTDVTLAADSDTKIATQKATKAYVDNAVGGVTSSQWTTSGADLYFNTGNVSIGNAIATRRLDVVGGDNDGLQYRTSTTAVGIGQVSSLPAMFWGVGTSLDFTSGGSSRMRILDTGKIGVGTTTPTAQLEVSNRTDNGIEKSLTLRNTATTTTATTGVAQELALGTGAAKAAIHFDGETLSNGRGNLNFIVNTANDTSAWNAGDVKMSINGDSGNVGIGTTTPGSKFEVSVQSSVLAQAARVTNPSTSAGSNRAVAQEFALGAGEPKAAIAFDGDSLSNGRGVLRFLVDSNDDTDVYGLQDAKMSILNSGEVGIGTGAPTSLLHIENGVDPFLTIKDPWGNTGNRDVAILFEHSNAIGAKIESVRASGNDNGMDMRFHTETTTGTLSERMRIAEDGNIGIGTTTPHAQLEIQGSTGGKLDLRTSDNNINGNEVFGEITFSNSDVDAPDDISRTAAAIKAMSPVTWGASTSSHRGDLAFFTQGDSATGLVERARLTRFGQFGINEDNPSSTLHVNGTTTFVNDYNAFSAQTTSGDRYIRTQFNNSDFIIHHDSGAMSINRFDTTSLHFYSQSGNTGNMRIGTGASGARLSVAGTTADSSAGALNVKDSAGANLFHVRNDGNVGIGTFAPDDALDVVGDVDATGCFQNNDGSSIGGTCVSDERLKDEIVSLDGSLGKILSLRPVHYVWRPELSDIHKREGGEVGLIAQEVEEVFPEMVVEKEDGYKRVKYDVSLKLYIISAIKEFFELFTKKNEDVDRKIASLEEENKMLKEYLCKKDPEAPFCTEK